MNSPDEDEERVKLLDPKYVDSTALDDNIPYHEDVEIKYLGGDVSKYSFRSSLSL